MNNVLEEAKGTLLQASPTSQSTASYTSIEFESTDWDIDTTAGDASSSEEVRRVLNKAASLARDLNHREMHLAHLMLALTLFPDAIMRLSQASPPLDPAKVREASWKELANLGPLNETPKRVGVSRDIISIHDCVQNLVRQEFDPSHLRVHVKHLVDAIVTGPVSGRVFERYGGVPTVPSPEEARVQIRDAKQALDQYLPRLQAWVQDLRLAVGGQRIASTFAEPIPDGLLDVAAKISTSIQQQGDHHAQLLKRVRNLKHLAVAALLVGCASLLVSAAFSFVWISRIP